MLEKKKKLTVLLVDDHVLIRSGFPPLLAQLDYELTIHEAATAPDGLALCEQHTPDLALVDLSLADESSLCLIKDIRVVSPRTAVLIVSMHDERAHAARVLRAGAKGYVMKGRAAEEILQAVRTVLDGEIWLSKEMRGIVLGKSPEQADSGNPATIASLTDRELEIFKLLSDGLSTAQISAKFEISKGTIDSHCYAIKRKFGVDSVLDLYRLAHSYFHT